ncbi:hypothetical protein BV25DRAFT_1917110 [Artomyces pyxidatus]|uniref:Uncharacterized protein n=1 Tax=Artomyces pyxidatus TaxID=48021 RepID=A0ACB8SY71_9AGAM|nr:hypothetical protein BV25DRAFT_1917110 [Artomyces pyxidatus]
MSHGPIPSSCVLARLRSKLQALRIWKAAVARHRATTRELRVCHGSSTRPLTPRQTVLQLCLTQRRSRKAEMINVREGSSLAGQPTAMTYCEHHNVTSRTFGIIGSLLRQPGLSSAPPVAHCLDLWHRDPPQHPPMMYSVRLPSRMIFATRPSLGHPHHRSQEMHPRVLDKSASALRAQQVLDRRPGNHNHEPRRHLLALVRVPSHSAHGVNASALRAKQVLDRRPDNHTHEHLRHLLALVPIPSHSVHGAHENALDETSLQMLSADHRSPTHDTLTADLLLATRTRVHLIVLKQTHVGASTLFP